MKRNYHFLNFIDEARVRVILFVSNISQIASK